MYGEWLQLPWICNWAISSALIAPYNTKIFSVFVCCVYVCNNQRCIYAYLPYAHTTAARRMRRLKSAIRSFHSQFLFVDGCLITAREFGAKIPNCLKIADVWHRLRLVLSLLYANRRHKIQCLTIITIIMPNNVRHYSNVQRISTLLVLIIHLFVLISF